MQTDTRLMEILEEGLVGAAPTKTDCTYLLTFPEDSLEAGLIRSVADYVSRRRFHNEAIVLGQIGVEIGACPGDCKFCSFGESHTEFEPFAMPFDEVLERAQAFTRDGDLYALFLMTMHNFDFDHFLETIAAVRVAIPEQTQIVLNMGDFDIAQAKELRAAGADGAYHVCRLREGTDTALDPEARKKTVSHICEAGLDWYYCCEPIGPEHTGEELVEQIFLGVERGCFQHAAMRRVYIPNTPLAQFGQITELRLAQVVAVIALASLACPETCNIAVHEPNLLGLTAGANVVYAETGANPRDTESDTTGHRGVDVAACRKMLYEAGFTQLLCGDGRRKDLAQLAVPCDTEGRCE